MNLYELLSSQKDSSDQTKLKGLNLQFVKMIAWQVLVALNLLSMPNVNIIHCDLKPENLMLRE